MAFWLVRKGCVPDMLPPREHDTHSYGGRHVTKRRGSGSSYDYEESEHVFPKRARFDDMSHHHIAVYNNKHQSLQDPVYDKGDMILTTMHNPPFIIIREHSASQDLASFVPENDTRSTHQTHIHLLNPNNPSPAPAPMERTASGHSISSSDSPPPEEPSSLLSDLAAAQLVHKHVSNVNRNARHARILRALVYPKTPSRTKDFIIDEDALESIFSAANDLFFANKLRGRVTWDWSHPDMASAGRYDCAIVGTTALRKRRGPKGGYETLIVLSSPILKDTKYNRRLLISTFLHEMIHSFLFVMCGRKAGIDGGHTEGFRKIAADIDDWVGRECLRLTDMEADLDRFTVDEQCNLNNHTCGGTGAVTYTELNAHHDHHYDQQRSQYNIHQPYQQQHQGYGVYHDEMETSPRYPPAESYSHYGHHSPYQEHGGEEWQWQRREGFGAARGAY